MDNDNSPAEILAIITHERFDILFLFIIENYSHFYLRIVLNYFYAK